ncbi:MAG: hypothetical protein JWN23_1720 [Rhodocyclales bacterium]|nr:hypothetical protein [Rhodocyclales bacterium]
MKHFTHIPLSILATLLAVFAAPVAQAFTSGSTGADGAFSPAVNTEVVLPPSGILNYTTVNIPAGVTVTFKKNAANTPVYILASGNVTIAGAIGIVGGDGAPTGTFGDGVLGDDGIPGVGGPGGFDGGRGGRDDPAAATSAVSRGGAGLGPGGGKGGVEGWDGQCTPDGYGYYRRLGTGGAYASNTYQPWLTSCGFSPAISINLGGRAYGSALLQPLIGGSGGGGGRGGSTYPGSGGGGGGGAILIATSGTLQLTGVIDAAGGDGAGTSGTGLGEQGAGGSGGAIRLMATTFTGSGRLQAWGGGMTNTNGRRQNWGCCDGGGNEYGGSPGRIRVEASAVTFSGSSDPAYSVDVPGPVFITGSPSLRIATVAGVTVPDAPTGVADVSLPATTTGPIVVTFQTTNVPTGNTVLLRLVPAYGAPTEALSPAITGSTAAGTTQVSVTLPQGPSTLQATTTYTIVIASNDGDSLSRFAQNERVEKVEVTVALQGPAQAKLITASGKSYEVPYAALQAIGFRG